MSTTRHTDAGWGAAPHADGAPSAGWAGRHATQNVNVLETISLVCPRQVKAELPASEASTRTVLDSRETIKQIIAGTDRRLLVVVGPCSIHDEQAALEYAERLSRVRSELIDRLYIVMRVYFEKPRTTVGWKGLINDPYMDGSFNIEVGIRRARQLLMQVTEMGMPTGTEMLEPITPQYIADVVSWASIGARTIESQTHRQMASGLSMPVGFKNGTSGNLDIAVNAMESAKHPHRFLGIDDDGRTAVIRTRGNPWGHLILRGGRSGPNYDPDVIASAVEALKKASLSSAVVVDCSHANSGKKYQNQPNVWQNVVEQRIAGNVDVAGVLVESNLFEGNQPLPEPPASLADLRYGVSVTDECIGWEQTEDLLRWTYDKLGSSR